MPDLNQKGVLYVVATPIGNLEDITYRAVRILREADLIACEDTRHTRKLLDHYGIEAKLLSYHEHNEAERASELAHKLHEGLNIAQVSDAGMPGISDPGYRLIRLAIEQGIRVVPVPGPSAPVAALAGSGLATDAFEFRGFLPARSGQRRTLLEQVRGTDHTMVFYEAPHRIHEAVEDILIVLGPATPLVIAREMTKLHEEFLRGTAAEIAAAIRGRDIKGEITILIGKSVPGTQAGAEADLGFRLKEIMREQSIDEKAALKLLARERGVSKSEVYRELQRGSKRK